MVLSYRTAILPLLPDLATQLAKGFQASHQGCFLWATNSVLREFSEGSDNVNPDTSLEIYKFFEAQARAFLRVMNDLPPQDLPDGKPFALTPTTAHLSFPFSPSACVLQHIHFKL